MSKEICISSTPHETRLAIIEDDQLTEVYYERENEYTLAGSIYKGRVTRVLPGMQSAFVDVGLERDAFLYVTDFLEEQEDSAEFERVAGNGGQEERASRDQRQQAGSEQKELRIPNTGSGASSRTQDGEGTGTPAAEFTEGTRRWRGRRGRRNRGLRPQQSAQEASQTTPRNSEPPVDFTPVEEVEVQEEPAAQTPEIPVYLPGESLSKYGGPNAAKASVPAAADREPQRTSYAASKPSTLIETPIEWNGAGLLPGESRTRLEEASVVTESVTDEAVGTDASPVAGMEPVTGHVERDGSAHADSFSGAGAVEEITPIEADEPVAAETTVVAEDLQESEVVEEVAEFEAEGASASYRIDPVPPSEFRVTTPSAVLEELQESEAFPAIPEIERHFQVEHSHEQPLPTAPTPEVEQPSEFAEQPQLIEQDEESSVGDFYAEFDDLAQGLDAPMGLLEEEEVSEEEEYDFLPLYAHQDDHDLEDMEEETLDRQTMSGPEIDDLVRDTHIEQRIHGEPGPLTIEEAEEAEQDEIDGEGVEVAPESEVGEVRPTPAAGQPARRDRHDQRRGGRGNRQEGRRRHEGRRQMTQTSDLPIISELLKQGQEILVQIAKEPIAKKGARITSHIALPGRFLVFMPTVNHVGVSRKISSDEERQRLKRILISEKGTGGGGFIVRTAADGASEEDLRADIRFLISLWTEIKQRADAGKAPALIYHDLNLVERVLRDQVSDNFSTIWVDSELEYERIVRFLNRFQPSLVRRVKLYSKETPLFEQFGIQDEISKALKSKVWLKSGGSIVINQTEALVAIDINTGKYVGKTARLEDTILKTNLDAIPEIVRQIRLRDLGGIIVIDFIDMDERKNRHKVMQALEEALKADRAPSKVLQFNDFGLVAITRKRVKQSLERTLCVQCSVCAGTGMTKSPTTVCNEIYVEMRKMQRSLERHDVLLRVHPEVVKTLKGNNARWLSELEEMTGKTIIVKSDPALHPEQFDIH
ncbi:MAG TPA: Rne/Rng family ribonuclease [Acidobacteriaceae bacterium]